MKNILLLAKHYFSPYVMKCEKKKGLVSKETVITF